MEELKETKFSKFLAVGLFLTTIVVMTIQVSDPVNVPKLLILGTFSFGILPYFTRTIIATEKYLFGLGLSYIILSFIVSFLSEAPFSQNFYGLPGRNTGIIASISFVIILFFASSIRFEKNSKLLIWALMLSGVVNIIYGIVEHFFGDPIPWINNYGALLGTFGNPDFAGAFYGLLIAFYLSFALAESVSLRERIIYIILTILSFICVIFTKTTQGMLVALISFTLVMIAFMHFRIKRKFLTFTFSIFVLSGGIVALLGIFQRGPLENFLYKRSVSLRGIYWDAAFNTGMSHFFTGVGLDSFGDWYRRERSLKAATWFPGPDTITNVAHNYYLDIFATGGILYLIVYFTISLIGLISAIKIIKSMKNFNPINIGLIVFFLGFQAQAIISIPQLGIAIWGWVVIGLLYRQAKFADEKNVKFQNQSIKKKTIRKTDSPIGVFIFVSSAIGLLISVPPYSADSKYRSALESSDLNKLESALASSYFSPSTSERLAAASYLLEQNKLYEQSHKYAVAGVKFNQDYFDAWKVLYFVKNSSSKERALALENMRRLDPLNKELETLK